VRPLADQGNASTQLNLGIMYANGFGVPRNYTEAMKWYRLAAYQGDADAQLNLGINVRQGNRVCVRPAGHTICFWYEVETLLIAAVERARAAYAAGANDMGKGAARPARAKEICAVLNDDLHVSKWHGNVETLSSNSDGLGVLSSQIAEGISIKTWNNALSDIEGKTLIDPDSAVFKQAVALKIDQKVIFAGQFIPSPTDCIREGSLTLEGSLTKPEFIFRFSNIAPVE
jgi:hypothetical protein